MTTLEVYQDHTNLWRWRLVHAGEVVTTSQKYTTRQKALEVVKKVKILAPIAIVKGWQRP